MKLLRRIRPLALLALLPIAGCMRAPSPDPVEPRPVFDAFAFFAGHSRGAATLRVLFRSAVPVAVESHGRIEGDVLVLDQTIREGVKPARNRQWRIHRTGPGRYAGTLSDATSPISGDVEGNRLHLRFTMKGGLDTQQWLSLSPDGRVAHNVMLVRKFGLTIAVLEERIERIDPA